MKMLMPKKGCSVLITWDHAMAKSLRFKIKVPNLQALQIDINQPNLISQIQIALRIETIHKVFN